MYASAMFGGKEARKRHEVNYSLFIIVYFAFTVCEENPLTIRAK
jgi:hypothetical protein